MDGVPTTELLGTRCVFYAGRFADRVARADLPDGCRVLDEWQVLPSLLSAAMEQAAILVVLDPLSFPFDVMTEDQWDVPMVLVLPSGLEGGFLETVFGEAVFERLGFFDRVATRDSALWERLSEQYGWIENQRIDVEAERPEEAAAQIQALIETKLAGPLRFGEGPYDACRYRNELFKAVHRVQARTLEPQFAAARGDRAREVRFDVLEVGVGAGRWVPSFDPAKTRFVGLDVSEEMVGVASSNFPQARFDHLGSDLFFPYDDESFDLVYTVTVLHHNPTPAKRTLLSEMWRVTRPGGRLLFLEDFVAERQSSKSTVYPMSVLQFVDLVLEVTAGQVVLEHVESLRYPRDDVFRGGAIALSRLGVPKKW
jgi:SAM-dependent methyltransferase